MSTNTLLSPVVKQLPPTPMPTLDPIKVNKRFLSNIPSPLQSQSMVTHMKNKIKLTANQKPKQMNKHYYCLE